MWVIYGMGTRLELHNELLKFLPNVYFQPPSNLQMKYPCMVYSRSGKYNLLADDILYLSNQQYQLTVIDRKADSTIADEVEAYLQYCRITNYFTVDNLHHITLDLTY